MPSLSWCSGLFNEQLPANLPPQVRAAMGRKRNGRARQSHTGTTTGVRSLRLHQGIDTRQTARKPGRSDVSASLVSSDSVSQIH